MIRSTLWWLASWRCILKLWKYLSSLNTKCIELCVPSTPQTIEQIFNKQTLLTCLIHGRGNSISMKFYENALCLMGGNWNSVHHKKWLELKFEGDPIFQFRARPGQVHACAPARIFFYNVFTLYFNILKATFHYTWKKLTKKKKRRK